MTRKTRVALASYVATVCKLSTSAGGQVTIKRPVGGLLGSPVKEAIIADVNKNSGKFNYSWFSNDDDCSKADEFLETYAYELLCKATGNKSSIAEENSWLANNKRIA